MSGSTQNYQRVDEHLTRGTASASPRGCRLQRGGVLAVAHDQDDFQRFFDADPGYPGYPWIVVPHDVLVVIVCYSSKPLLVHDYMIICGYTVQCIGDYHSPLWQSLLTGRYF